MLNKPKLLPLVFSLILFLSSFPIIAQPNLVCEVIGFGDLIIEQNSFTHGEIIVRNTGNSQAGASTLGYYLSTDRTITRDDIRVGEIQIGALAPNEFETHSFARSFSGIPNGTYYLGMFADDLSTVTETSGEDNTCFVETPRITIGPQSQPDLVTLIFDDLTLSGNTIILDELIDYCNIGTGYASSSHVGLYLSLDTDITTDDILIAEEAVGPVAVADPELCALVFFDEEIELTGVPAGEYFLGIITDHRNEVDEGNEGNNVNYYPSPKVVVQGSNEENRANLVCGDLGTLSIKENEISISNFQVRNSGSVTAGSSTVGFYLSEDTDIQRGDIQFTTRSVGPIEPGQSRSISFSQTIANIPNGTYYVGMFVDDGSTVTETNGNDNNCYYSSEQFTFPNSGEEERANLVCGDLGTLSINGNEISISNFQVRNSGSVTAGSSTVGFYLSEDTDIQRGDIQFTIRSVGPIEPGQSRSISLSQTISNIPNGTYYVGMFVDDGSTVTETNGNDNNCYYSSEQFTFPNSGEEERANLVCGDLGTLSINGNEISISNFQVRNSGSVTAGSSTVGFYLSEDTDIQRGDIQFTTRSVGPIEPGQSRSISFSQTISNIPNGTYYVGMFVDDGSTVIETNGNDNNCFYSSEQFTFPNSDPQPTDPEKANLVCGSLGSLEINGATISISGFEVLNTGGTPAGNSTVGFYLSTDTDIQRSDIQFDLRSVGPLQPNQTQTLNVSKEISNIPNGTYYIGMFVDDGSTVPETNGNDNNCYFASEQFTFPVAGGDKANLVCGDLGTMTFQNGILTISDFEVRNIGGTQAPSSTVGYYLSTDPTINRNDIRIGGDAVGPLSPNQSSAESFSTSLSNISNGTYYVGMVVDDTGTVPETSGEDNFCHYSNTISIGSFTSEASVNRPNLVCGDLGQATFNETTSDLTINGFTLENSGFVNAGESTVGFYLSTDPNITRDDISIGAELAPPLDAESSTIINFSTNISGVPNGNYFIGVVVDDLSTVLETSGEDNFCFYSTPIVSINQATNEGPNLVCGDLGNLNINGNQVSISQLEIINIGDSRAGTSHIGYYLSEDTNITRDDYLIGEDFIEELNSGTSSFVSFSQTVSNVPDGTYYVGIVVDYRGEVTESSGEDNFCLYENRTLTLSQQKPNLVCGTLGTLTQDGNQVSLTNFEVINIGSDTSGTSQVGFYLSEDVTITRDDIRIGGNSVRALGPNLSSTEEFSTTLTNVESGTYYFGIIVDDAGEVNETSGFDNFCHFESPRIVIENKPNLVCGGLGTLAVDGLQITISGLQVANVGEDRAGQSHVGIYLSPDRDIQRSDIGIGSIQIPSIDVGDNRTISEMISIDPSNIPRGTYFVGIVVDDSGEVPETDGTDNFCFYEEPIVVIENLRPNLVCGGVGNLQVEGETYSISDLEIRNIGPGNAEPSHVGIYLSLDTQIDKESDHLMDEISIGPIENGESIFQSISSNIPNIQQGTYFIGIFVDYKSEVLETSGFDNVCFYDSPTVEITEPCNLTTEITVSNPTCGLNNGSISIQPSGNQGRVEYSWSNGSSDSIISNLLPGIYVVEIRDNICIQTRTIEVEERISDPAPPEFEVENLGELSYAFSIKSSLNNSYFWEFGDESEQVVTFNTMYTFNSAGTYTVCLHSFTECDTVFSCQTIVVNGNCDLALEANLTNPSCSKNNGAIFTEVLGGSPPYFYEWNTGDTNPFISGLYPFTYTLLVKDSKNCVLEDTFKLENLNDFRITVEDVLPSNCNAPTGRAEVKITGGQSPYTIRWKNGGFDTINNNLGVGKNFVQVSDNQGCTQKEEFIVESDDPSNHPVAIAKFSYKKNGSSISFTDQSQNVENTKLVLGDGTVLSRVDTTYYYNENDSSALEVSLIAENSCNSDTLTKLINLQFEDPCEFNYSIFQSEASCNSSDATAGILISDPSEVLQYTWLTSPVSFGPFKNGLSTGFHHVVVTSSSCIDTIEIKIEGAEGYPRADFEPEIQGDRLVLRNLSQNGNSYFWELSTGEVFETVNPALAIPSDSLLSIQLTAQNNCGADISDNRNFEITKNGVINRDDSQNIPTQVKEAFYESLLIYPNPTKNILFIEGLAESQFTNIKLLNLQGQEIFFQNFSPHQVRKTNSINLPDIPKGIYFLHIQQRNTGSVYKKIEIL